MKMDRKHEEGAITVEASIALPIFVFAFLAIAMLANISRVEGSVQYAIDQTCKDVSRYCYVASKANIVSKEHGENAEKLDDFIGAVSDFGSLFSSGSTSSSGGGSDITFDSVFDTLSNTDSYGEIQSKWGQVASAGKALAENPEETIKILAKTLLSEGAKTAGARFLATPVCQALVPRYISPDADAWLKHYGVKDGLSGLDFSLSSFLLDDRTINIVVIYHIKPFNFNLFDYTIDIKQSASTAAWLASKEGKTLKETEKKAATKWGDPALLRGKEFVDEMQLKYGAVAIAPGVGIDLYDYATNTFYSVDSINLFAASYSQYFGDSEDQKAEDFTLEKSPIKSKIKEYARALAAKASGLGGTSLEREFPLVGEQLVIQTQENDVHKNCTAVIVVPIEAKSDAEKVALLEEIAAEIKAETGVDVSFVYDEEALQKP